MPEWSFTLLLNQPFTPEQADEFSQCDAFADGSAAFVLGPRKPEQYPVRSDESELKKLICDVEAPTLLDAVAQMARNIQLIPGLRGVGALMEDKVALEEAAQRCDRSYESLVQLSQEDEHFPEPLNPDTEGTVFYSWLHIADYLRRLGDDVPHTPRELVIADRTLRLVEDLRGTDVQPGVLRALGLP
ncbi:hypothetical protein GCM10022247_38950 [Allokutzneria multivorans]|uniref:Uncharacterized protein n=1 Tax=Allokutzneria multivorans TaxID=1142134 RepID=A0ABP7SJH6_9PSEU